MSSLTPEQQLAVDKKGTNIIVSAGAGSGKTTVLQNRVVRELKEGVSIENLILLTFTNNAAKEMKTRIRNALVKEENLKEEVEKIDSAYITTFDSFAQSIVKKYHYLLHIDKQFSIIDNSLLQMEIKKIVDDLFEEYYANEDADFASLIGNFCVKDDTSIRKSIVDILGVLNNRIDKDEFLNHYLEDAYSDEFIKRTLSLYVDLLFEKRDELLCLFERLEDETNDVEKGAKNASAIANFREATTYDELRDSLSITLAQNRNNLYTEEGAKLKKKFSDEITDFKKQMQDDEKTLIKHYKETKPYARVLVRILLALDERLNQFKKLHNAYTFTDIAFFAISLVRDYKEVRDEIKANTFEIMIDEYQDTSDIQEAFVSYIENNNVYMVGDIKQSIYRFRNANPYLFKRKYDAYKENMGGFKIDLNKNFRSREEVVNNINLIFNDIMQDEIGGAKYKEEHQMVFGNKTYSSVKENRSYDMEVLHYTNETEEFNEFEIEAFAIARDIENRIKTEQVVFFNQGEMSLRPAEYHDFTILIDRSSNFELFKKILESQGIPVTIEKDISIKEEDELYLLKNLVILLIKIKEEKYDNEFKHAYLSIARSYLMQMPDEDLFTIITEKTWTETTLFKKCLKIVPYIEATSNAEILNRILDEFDIYKKMILVGDIEERISKLEYFLKNMNQLNEFGLDIYALKDYFDEVLNGDYEMKMSALKSSGNAVLITTIHKSKGLEYSYVYLPDLNHSFQNNGSKKLIQYASSLGFLLPFYENGKGHTYLKEVFKEQERKEELSEKIRLFYVALTRAKEKVIFLTSFDKKKDYDLKKAKSLNDLLGVVKYALVPYTREIDLNSLTLTKDYQMVKVTNYKELIKPTTDAYEVSEIHIEEQISDNHHFSKPLSKRMDRDLKERLDFGTTMHAIFEIVDFKNPENSLLSFGEEERKCIQNFLNHKEVKEIKKANIRKEYEIYFTSELGNYHGFIDLLLEYEDHFDIIDYKLSNVNGSEYESQLKGYKDYIESQFGKPVNLYLYSIKKDFFKKVC